MIPLIDYFWWLCRSHQLYDLHHDLGKPDRISVTNVWSRICSVWCNHNTILYLFMTYNQVSNKGNTTVVSSWTEIANHFGAFEFTSVFCGVSMAQTLVFCVELYRSLFVLFLLVIALSVLRFTTSNYPFDIFKRLKNGIIYP